MGDNYKTTAQKLAPEVLDGLQIDSADKSKFQNDVDHYANPSADKGSDGPSTTNRPLHERNRHSSFLKGPSGNSGETNMASRSSAKRAGDFMDQVNTMYGAYVNNRNIDKYYRNEYSRGYMLAPKWYPS